MAPSRSFELSDEAVQAILDRGRSLASAVELPAVDGPPPGIAEMVALFHSAHPTESLRAAAIARRGAGTHELETFSPLYLTNTCDSECRMCGMRRDNDRLLRDTATPAETAAQLRILKRRGVLAVGLLTGEYREETRRWSTALAREALGEALALEFRHVLVNVGSLGDDELAELLQAVPRDGDGRVTPKVTLCTFQETYDRRAYRKFMGTNPDNPRADFDRRLTNLDRAADAGMRVVNPGVLLGLSAHLDFELAALALHVQHLLGRGLEVYVSVPRLRQASGAANERGVSDDEFVRLLAILALGLPAAKVVVTTRESAAVQRRVLPLIKVLSAGSSAVAPYTADGARFPLEASQFEVIDQRPIEEILAEYLRQGVRFENFEPVSA
ncbi:MAG: 2-iminoacetate synthase [Candidatus Binatota bacterium]|nr:2-iminoacetate synthase [Candidatus Binatota bacterium]